MNLWNRETENWGFASGGLGWANVAGLIEMSAEIGAGVQLRA